MLEKAPRGKGSEMDIAVLKGDIAGIESSLTETEGAFAAEHYLESKATATAALASAQKIREEIVRATDMARKTPRRS
jgi:hypothetical protein